MNKILCLEQKNRPYLPENTNKELIINKKT